MVYPGDVVVREKGEILKRFSIKLQWIPVFGESGLIVSWAGVTRLGGSSTGAIPAGKILEVLGEALECGV